MTKKDITIAGVPSPNDLLNCVCADCGHEQITTGRCGKCRSVRVVLESVIRDLFGENWREVFAPSSAKETP